MAYATALDFEKAFTVAEAVELSNLDDADATTVNAAALDVALDDASSEIDDYLRGRYDLPFASPPDRLSRLCLDIARYMLESRDPREDVRQRYEDALRFLDQVSRGRVVLDVPVPEQEAVQGVGMPQYHTPDRIFTHESLRGY